MLDVATSPFSSENTVQYHYSFVFICKFARLDIVIFIMYCMNVITSRIVACKTSNLHFTKRGIRTS